MNKTIVRRSVEQVEHDYKHLPSLLENIYLARGITRADDLERGLQHLLPYHTLSGIENAVTCLMRALDRQETVVVVGDFDADGATSCALALTALRSFGLQNISYLVPNRFKYGYGLTPEIVDESVKRQPHLIVTVDNGISSIAGVARAKTLGIKVLITDHHLPAATLPAADAIVNPNQPNDFFPSKCLAGVGVIFYVMLALRAYLRKLNWFAEKKIIEPNMADLLDLVALGTVADVVSLDKNNRILVYQGLQRIRAGKSRAGIQALLIAAGRQFANLSSSDLGFAVGPRLNAAGRLDDMSLGIACLLSETLDQAQALAIQLDQLNKERQAIEAEMQQQAFSAIANIELTRLLPRGICLFDKNWHQGVVGIVASRIKDKYQRPVVAFALVNNGTELKGSARSVQGVHIRDIFAAIAAQHPELVDKFGGHAMAAGISLLPENLSTFSSVFAREVEKFLSEEDLQGKIQSDGELSAENFNLKAAQLLREAGPWGQAFPEPLFDNEFTIIQQRLVGNKHLKLVLMPTNASIHIQAIAFNVDTQVWPNYRCQKIHAAYRLDINEYRGFTDIQLLVEYFFPL